MELKDLFEHAWTIFTSGMVGLGFTILACFFLYHVKAVQRIVSPNQDELADMTVIWRKWHAQNSDLPLGEIDVSFANAISRNALARAVVIGLILTAVLAPW